MNQILIGLLSLLTIGAGVGVVIAKNAVISAFNLIILFFLLAIWFLVWESPLIAMLQILIYAGAIVVLFVFVVMLLDLRKTFEIWTFHRTVVLAVMAVSVTLGLLFFQSVSQIIPPQLSQPNATSLRVVSLALFTQYLWAFEILSLFLLAMMIAIFSVARPMEGETE